MEPRLPFFQPKAFVQEVAYQWGLAQTTDDTTALLQFARGQGVDIYVSDSKVETLQERVGALIESQLKRKMASPRPVESEDISRFFSYVREIRRLRDLDARSELNVDVKQRVTGDARGMVNSALSYFCCEALSTDELSDETLFWDKIEKQQVYSAELFARGSREIDKRVIVDPISRKIPVQNLIPTLRLPKGCEILMSEDDESHPLGEGGFSIVYKATLTLDGRPLLPVAIKTPKVKDVSQEQSSKSFQRDLEFLGKFSNDGILRLLGRGSTCLGREFAVLEFLEGEVLNDYILKPHYEHDKFFQIWQLAQKISLVHRSGIAHGDIKPENVFIRKNGSVVLMDFGNASFLNVSEDRRILGHLFYLPPEILRECETMNLADLDSDAKTRWDVYSFGITAYMMLSGGYHPYLTSLDLDSEQVLKNAKDTYSDVNLIYRDLDPSIPEELRFLIKKCLEVNPRNRFNDMTEVARACDRFLPDAKFTHAYHQVINSGNRVTAVRVLREWDEDLFLSTRREMNERYERQKSVFEYISPILAALDQSDESQLLRAEFYYRYARALTRHGNKRSDYLMQSERFLDGLPPDKSLELRVSILAEQAYYFMSPEDALSAIIACEETYPFIPPLHRARLQMAKMKVLRSLKYFEDALDKAGFAVDNFKACGEGRRANEAVAGVGNCLISLHRYPEAIVKLEEACMIARTQFDDQGNNVDALYINLGEAYLRNGQYQEAIATLEGARLKFLETPHMLTLLEYLREAYDKCHNNLSAEGVDREISYRRKMAPKVA